MDEIAAVVLAAGASRRFGTDKLLHPVSAEASTWPLIARSLRPWLEVFPQVTVVIRLGSGELQSRTEEALGLQSAAIRWCVCAEAERGMAASLACGIAENPGAGGWVIGLADMPHVPTDAIAAVREAIAAGASLAAPFYNGKRGHPVGFAASYREELLQLQGDAGARDLLQRDAARLQRVEAANSGILIDIDSPEDLMQHPL
jgi:molybdenum cofactor cytidylyltransferase